MRKIKVVFNWSVSHARNTDGYMVCVLRDGATGRMLAKTCGGGYDMKGTVLGEFIQNTYADRIVKLKADASNYGLAFYGMNHDGSSFNKETWAPGDAVYLDGACGMSAMQSIMLKIGLNSEWGAIGRGGGETMLIEDDEGGRTAL